MGIGLVADGMFFLVGKGSTKVRNQIRARNDSVEKQTIENGLAQIRKGEQEFRADKNAPIADRHQGAHISEVNAEDARMQLERTRTEWGSEDGSTGSVTTPLERERVAREGGTSEDIVEKVYQNLVSTEKFARELDAVRGNRQALADKYRYVVDMHQEITGGGRNAAELSTDEYLGRLWEETNTVNGQEIWTARNVVAADLVIGSLLKQLRDTGIAGREIMNFVSVDDIDGPAKQIVDTMLTAIEQTKRTRLVLSDEFKGLDARAMKEAVNDTVKKEMADTKEAIITMLKIAKDDADDNLLQALFETFSMIKDFRNLEDFDNLMRTLLKGGKLDANAPDRTGALIRSLQETMSHSIPSGPKTPMRALMGTSAATMLRPLSTLIGATMRYPFNGDAATIRCIVVLYSCYERSYTRSI